MAKADLTAQRLRELLHYDPETGVFTWAVSKRNGVIRGRPAGCVSARLGYVVIRLDGTLYYAHRLAWLYVHDTFPTMHIDHINGEPSDNRIVNLRDVSNAINRQNERRARVNNLSTGSLGVHKSGTRFVSQISHEGKCTYIGIFKTKDAAHSAYLKAKRELHEGCTI